MEVEEEKMEDGAEEWVVLGLRLGRVEEGTVKGVEDERDGVEEGEEAGLIPILQNSHEDDVETGFP